MRAKVTPDQPLFQRGAMDITTDSSTLPEETVAAQPLDSLKSVNNFGKGVLWLIGKVLGVAIAILVMVVAVVAGIAAISLPIVIGFGLGMLFQPWLALVISLIAISYSLGEIGLLMDNFTDSSVLRWGTIALLMMSSAMFLTAVGNSPTLFNSAAKILSTFVR